MDFSIFEAEDTSAKTKYEPPKFRLHAGMKKPNGGPMSLKTWRFTSDSKETLEALAELFRVEVTEFTVKGDVDYHVLTNEVDMETVISSVDDIDSPLILWGPNGPIHKCDGFVFLEPAEDKGEPCHCPTDLKERKALADKKRGPAPYPQITFTLPGVGEELGKGLFIGSSSFNFAGDLAPAAKAVTANDAPTLVTFRKEFVSFTTDAGELREYTKTLPIAGGLYNDAIAE